MAALKPSAVAIQKMQQEKSLEANGLATITMACRTLNISIAELDVILKKIDAPKPVRVPPALAIKSYNGEMRIWCFGCLEIYVNQYRRFDFHASKNLFSVLDKTFHSGHKIRLNQRNTARQLRDRG